MSRSWFRPGEKCKYSDWDQVIYRTMNTFISTSQTAQTENHDRLCTEKKPTTKYTLNWSTLNAIFWLLQRGLNSWISAEWGRNSSSGCWHREVLLTCVIFYRSMIDELMDGLALCIVSEHFAAVQVVDDKWRRLLSQTFFRRWVL